MPAARGGRRTGLGLVAGAVLQVMAAVGLGAQQPTPRPQPPVPADTVRRPQQPGDTLRRPAAPDTVRARRDSVTVGAPAAGTDTTRRARIDSVRGIPDTLKTRVRRDSIQAPIARAEVPAAIGVGPLYRWTRDSVLSTGAVNLTDLLERVPGVTIFRSGFLASAQTAAYLGDFARVRVFRDGVELDALDPRSGGVRDVGDIQLGNIDELTVERAAGELRVHVRTWTVRNTTPYTRVDAFTGDEDTNLYRFFYGRRFGSGFDAQAGVQQYGTGSRNRRVGGGGNVLEALGRFGWSKRLWSADLTYTVLNRQRDLTRTFAEQDSVLPPYEGRRNEGYLRVGYGDPEGRGPWLQAIANTARVGVSGTSTTRFDTTFSVVGSSRQRQSLVVRRTGLDSVSVPDSAVSRRQFVLAGGWSRGPLRFSATDRFRVFGGSTYNSPSARASYESGFLSVSAFGEWNAVGGFATDTATARVAVPATRVTIDTTGTGSAARIDTTTKDTVLYRARSASLALPPSRFTRYDVSARLSPLPWVALLGSVSRSQPRSYDAFVAVDSATTLADSVVQFALAEPPAATTARLEAAVRLGRLWLSGGAIRRGATTLAAPTVYECVRGADCASVDADARRAGGRVEAAATGTVFGARGPFYKDAYVDATTTLWSSGGAYRPQYQVRGEVGVQTNWLSRFPSGNFGFKTAFIDEYRSRLYIPTAGDDPLRDAAGNVTREPLDLVLAPPTNVLTFQLEIRIQTGVVSYQLRNALNRRYELVPGLRMPGPVSYYGVRWTFWN